MRNRLTKGWTLHEACQVPKGGRLDDFRTEQKLKAINYDTDLGREKYSEEKRRNDRPWLYDGTPQKHTRCKYVGNLMKYDIFPKVVK